MAPKGWWAPFLDALAKTGTVRAACTQANVSRATVYRYKAKVPAFGRLWLSALADAGDRLEEAALSRAVVGVPKIIEHFDKQGNVTRRTTETQFSDRLLELMLKAKKSDEYREKIDHTHRDDPAVDAEIAELVAELQEMARDRQRALPEPQQAIETTATVRRAEGA